MGLTEIVYSLCHNDCVVTQVLYFEYNEVDKKYYIKPFDYEYIFYTIEKYDIRINDFTKKGTGQKRIKTFEADKCAISIDYMIKILDNNIQKSYKKYNVLEGGH